jgi:hypothetical protein
MSKGAGSGDKLARGAISATFTTTEGGISQKKWDDMFKDYDPERFAKEGTPKVKGEKNLVKI